MNLIRYSLPMFLLMLGLAACTSKKAQTEPETEYDKDLVEYCEFSHTVTIDFGDDQTPVISNPLEGNGLDVSVDGADVTLTSTTTNDVEYVLTGTTSNGSVKLYSDKKYKLTLNGVDITSSGKPALNLQSSKRAFVVLAAGTSNTLSDSGEYETDGSLNADGEDRKGAFFSEGQLVVSGTGSLTVNGNMKHALATDEYLRMREGTLTLFSDNADGLHAKEYVWIEDGTLRSSAKSDGIQCTKGYIRIDGGTLEVDSRDDCVRATYGLDVTTDTDSTIVTDITVTGGRITLISSKEKDTAYGLYTTGKICLSGGDFDITLYQRDNAVYGAKGVEEADGYALSGHLTYSRP